MSEDFLQKAASRKRQEVKEAEDRVSYNSLKRKAEDRRDRRSLAGRLEQAGPEDINIIAEIKRASPSKGDIRADLDPCRLASAYERGGACAVSVLTEKNWFKGSLSDLQAAKKAAALPVLRKDFIVDPYQVYESAAAGADAVLLIAAVLSLEEIRDFIGICRSLEIDVLLEIHGREDIEKAKSSGARLIGINNRNLRTLETDISTAVKAAGSLGLGQIPVAASGIRTRKDVEEICTAGIRNFLVGEHLVRAENPESFLRSLLGKQQAGV